MSSCAEHPGTEWLPTESCGFDPSLASAVSALWCRGTSYVVSVSAVKQESLCGITVYEWALSTGPHSLCGQWTSSPMSAACEVCSPYFLPLLALWASGKAHFVLVWASRHQALTTSMFPLSRAPRNQMLLLPSCPPNKLEYCLCCRHVMFRAFVACGTTNEISKLQMKTPGRGRIVGGNHCFRPRTCHKTLCRGRKHWV